MQVRFINYATMSQERQAACDEAEALRILQFDLGFTEGSFLVIDFGPENVLQFIVGKTGEVTAEIVINEKDRMTIWAKPVTSDECGALIAELYCAGELRDFSGFSKTEM